MLSPSKMLLAPVGKLVNYHNAGGNADLYKLGCEVSCVIIFTWIHLIEGLYVTLQTTNSFGW